MREISIEEMSELFNGGVSPAQVDGYIHHPWEYRNGYGYGDGGMYEDGYGGGYGRGFGNGSGSGVGYGDWSGDGKLFGYGYGCGYWDGARYLKPLSYYIVDGSLVQTLKSTLVGDITYHFVGVFLIVDSDVEEITEAEFLMLKMGGT